MVPIRTRGSALRATRDPRRAGRRPPLLRRRGLLEARLLHRARRLRTGIAAAAALPARSASRATVIDQPQHERHLPPRPLPRRHGRRRRPAPADARQTAPPVPAASRCSRQGRSRLPRRQLSCGCCSTVSCPRRSPSRCSATVGGNGVTKEWRPLSRSTRTCRAPRSPARMRASACITASISARSPTPYRNARAAASAAARRSASRPRRTPS